MNTQDSIRYLHDVITDKRLPKSSDTLTATIALSLFTKMGDLVEGQEKGALKSGAIRKNERITRESLWRQTAHAILAKQPYKVTKHIVSTIQSEGFKFSDRTIAKVVSPIVKAHRRNRQR